MNRADFLKSFDALIQAAEDFVASGHGAEMVEPWDADAIADRVYLKTVVRGLLDLKVAAADKRFDTRLEAEERAVTQGDLMQAIRVVLKIIDSRIDAAFVLDEINRSGDAKPQIKGDA